MKTIDLTPLFQAIIALLAALITSRVIPYIKSRTTRQQQENLQAAVKIAVYAAEQIFGGGQGAEKLRYVRERLNEAGFDVDGPLVAEAIEKAVREMNLNMAMIDYGEEDHGGHYDDKPEEVAADGIPGIAEPIEELIEPHEPPDDANG